MLRLSQRLPALRYCQSGTRIGTFGLAGYTNTRSAACVRTAVRLRRGRTSFVIATGCPPSATPDTIVVMDNGRISPFSPWRRGPLRLTGRIRGPPRPATRFRGNASCNCARRFRGNACPYRKPRPFGAAGQRRQDRNGGRGIREQLLWIINRGAAVLIAGSSRDLPRHPVWCGRHLPLSQYG
jgi:hypothetical protein